MQERRLHPRTTVLKAARLFNKNYLGHGVVRDISASGVRLQVVGKGSIPDTFDLSFDGGRTLRVCRVIWRTAAEFGLRFL